MKRINKNRSSPNKCFVVVLLAALFLAYQFAPRVLYVGRPEVAMAVFGVRGTPSTINKDITWRDSKKIKFGTDGDCTLEYDGSDLVFTCTTSSSGISFDLADTTGTLIFDNKGNSGVTMIASGTLDFNPANLTFFGANVTSGAGQVAFDNAATPPTSLGIDSFALWSQDIATGQAAMFLMTESEGISSWNNLNGTTNRWGTQEDVADSGKVIMAAPSNGGFGFARLGDAEYALFTFTSAAAVTLISTSGANVGTTEDNDTTFNIYDNGTAVGFNNELGSTLNLFVMVWYD
ncbi:hypothetical protein LCGC14_0394080 [marine sediment metagenome]|uniref:Uncharacterized protein n=1 Tax=marine sediment metagenome TaxID=412755 RepID=A0A0F9W7P0_9ZZZZ